MLRLALRNLTRRPVRNGLALAGMALAVAVLACLSAFGAGYQRARRTELDRMGMQLMLVPLGCPYDAAARVLKGNTLEASLPQSALQVARRDPAVAVAAPLLLAALPRSCEGRTDLWAGLDEAARELKPWWPAVLIVASPGSAGAWHLMAVASLTGNGEAWKAMESRASPNRDCCQTSGPISRPMEWWEKALLPRGPIVHRMRAHCACPKGLGQDALA